MKKNVLIMVIMLAWFAGGTDLFSQWQQYNADLLPLDTDTLFEDGGTTLLGGTSEIIVDPDSAENNLWKFDIDRDAADEIQYKWNPASGDGTPAPATFAVKSRWIDTAGYYCGIDMEIRETFKVQAKFVNKSGIKLRVKDWALDSIYNLPEEFDVTEWHVLRLTVANGEWKIYIDEADTAFAAGTAGKQVDKMIAIFGAYAETGLAGVEVDWMGYIAGESLSPTDMPLPEGVFAKEEEPSVGISSKDASHLLSVYPNPVGDILTISVDSKHVNSGYELIEISGRTIQSGIIASPNHRIDVSSLQPGMYFIKIVTDSKTLSGSFIVQ